jgi:hypothetical protein
MAVENLNTEDESTPAPLTTDGDELADSLVIDDTPEAVAEQPAEEVADDVPAEEPAPEAEAPGEPAAEATTETETPAEQPVDPPQQPGTADKALQKLQQDNAAINRKLEAVLAKIEESGKATPQQVQQVATLQAKAEEVADEIAAIANATTDTVDAFDGTIKVAKRVVTHDKRIASLEERVQQAEARAAQAEEAASWIKVEQKYPGVNVRSVWEQALQKAEALGYEGKALAKRADELFHETAAAAVTKPETPAAKPATPVPQPKAPIKPAPTARKAPPTTPGGASVTAKANGAIKRPAPVSDEEKWDRLADSLIQ